MKKFFSIASVLMIVCSGTSFQYSHPQSGDSADSRADRVTAIPANDFLSSIGVNSSIDTRGEKLEKTLESMQCIGARWTAAATE